MARNDAESSGRQQKAVTNASFDRICVGRLEIDHAYWCEPITTTGNGIPMANAMLRACISGAGFFLPLTNQVISASMLEHPLMPERTRCGEVACLFDGFRPRRVVFWYLVYDRITLAPRLFIWFLMIDLVSDFP